MAQMASCFESGEKATKLPKLLPCTWRRWPAGAYWPLDCLLNRLTVSLLVSPSAIHLLSCGMGWGEVRREQDDDTS